MIHSILNTDMSTTRVPSSAIRLSKQAEKPSPLFRLRLLQSLFLLLLFSLFHPISMDAQTKININIGGKSFTATLENNATAEAFAAMLPSTWIMDELNGNEKYVYLDTSLPSTPTRYETIHTGDIMLYGNNCIVVFYKTFRSGYSYTPIAHIDNPENLPEAVGNGTATVAFSLLTTGIGEVRTTSTPTNISSIDGVRISADKAAKPGIYIIDGRKRIIR